MSTLIETLDTPVRPGLSLQSLEKCVPAAFATHRFERTGPKYAFISTRDLVEALLAAGFYPADARQRMSRGDRRGYARHMIRFRHESGSVQIVDCVPEVILINSHDSTSSYQLRGGLYRFVCCNGLIISLAEFGSICVPHRGNVVAEVVEGAIQITRRFEGIGRTIEQMARTELHLQQQRDFAQRALAVRYKGREAFPFDAEKLLVARRQEDSGNTLWAVYNRIQEHLIQGGIDGRAVSGRKSTSRKITAIPEDIRINLELWQYATSLIKA
ncbi:MAG: DUF932 domain-containing protein [Steroidobacteraceae bacterium]